MPCSGPLSSAEPPGRRGGPVERGEEERGGRGGGGGGRSDVPLGWAQKRVKREKGGDGGGRRREAHLILALEEPLGKGWPRRLQNAVRAAVRPGRGAAADARGVSAGSEVSVCGSTTSRLREAPGSLPGVQGSRRAPPADAPSPGSAWTPGFSGPRAGSPGARAPRPKLGRRGRDPDAGHSSGRPPPLRGEPQPSGPQPRRRDPAPATGTKGNKTSRNPPSRFRRDLTLRRRRAARGGTVRRGRAGGRPAPTGLRPCPGQRRQGSSASPSAALPTAALLLRPPRRCLRPSAVLGREGTRCPRRRGGSEAAAAGH